MVGSLTWSMIRNKRGYNPINNNVPLVKTGNNHASKPFENRNNSKGWIDSREHTHWIRGIYRGKKQEWNKTHTDLVIGNKELFSRLGTLIKRTNWKSTILYS